MEVTHVVHGISFNRSGACHQCPGMHPPPCGCGDCPHYAVDNDLNVCLVHGFQEGFCETCQIDHSVCARFPDHPWLHVIMDGVCGYTFTRVDEDGNPDNTTLPFMD